MPIQPSMPIYTRLMVMRFLAVMESVYQNVVRDIMLIRERVFARFVPHLARLARQLVLSV